MITDLLSNHPWLGASAFVLWQLVELALGLKKPMDAGSVPQLLWKMILRVTNWRKSSTEVSMVSANPNIRTLQVAVDGPTYDALGILADTVKQIANGADPQSAFLSAIPRFVSSFGQMAQIPKDLELDRASVVEAVSQRLGDVGEAFVLARTAVVPK